MHNKHIKVYTDAGWFTWGRIYRVTEDPTYRRHCFEDIKTRQKIYISSYGMPDAYRMIGSFELCVIKHWLALLAFMIAGFLVGCLSSCTKQPVELSQPQKTRTPMPCELKYFTGTYVIVNKSPWLLLDTVRFTRDDVRMRAEYTQQTTVNDTPIYYHALATCDSLWTFSNEGFGINHVVRFDTAGILVDSLVIAGVGYGVNRYKKL